MTTQNPAVRSQLAEIVELAPSFMVVLRGPAFVIETANEAYRRLTGQRELIGLPLRQAFPEVEGQGFFELIERVYATGEPWVGSGIPVTLQRQPGAPPEERYLDLVYQALRSADGSINGVFAHGVDITERMQAEKALRNAVEHAERQAHAFDTLLSTMTDFAYTFDRDGRFLYVNKALLELWQLPLAKAIGRNFFDLKYPGELAAKLQRQIRQVFDTREGIVDEASYTSPAGTVGHYEYIFRPVLGAHREVDLVAGSTRDITARKQAEDALKDADRRKTEFLAMLAHELRNPLAPIRSAVQFLRLADGDREAVRPVFEMMERQVAQMARLIDDLLDVSRISRGSFELRSERVELAAVLQQAVETVRPLCADGEHELTVMLPARPVHLSADPARLIQIVGNLLNNACKFSGRGGRIRLAVERDGDQIVIRVGDDGIGIAATELSRVFEMFTQLDTSLARSRGGLGIGLTLVRSLVEMHGGSVEARSGGAGQGSEFVVRLPLPAGLPASPQDASPAAPAPMAPALAGRRILVVDDNRDAADTLAMLLAVSGHEVRTAYDGLQAVEAAATWRPDVVLLDIGLPGLDGYEAARRMRAQRDGVVLVAMTGWGQDDDRRRSREAGFDAHLTKPVDYADLTKVLAERGTGSK